MSVVANLRRVLLGSIVLAAALLAWSSGAAWAQGGEDLIRLMLVEGDSLEVRFSEPICAKRLAKGEAPRAEIASSKIITSLVAVEEGAPVKVTVIESKSNGRAGKGGRLVFNFESVTAADGAEIPLGLKIPIERAGKGKNIIVKVLTLFLVKGGDPCVGTEERFHPKVRETRAVYLERR